jgi:hypothetical protein
MTINDPIVGLLGFLVVMMINRVLAEKALKRLSAEEKAGLLDSFAGYRVYGLAAIVVLVVGYFIAAKARPDLRVTLVWVFFGLVMLHAILITLLSYQKLKTLAAPADYQRNFLVRSALQFVALVFLLFTFVNRYSAY